jgi:hypothetical protein
MQQKPTKKIQAKKVAKPAVVDTAANRMPPANDPLERILRPLVARGIRAGVRSGKIKTDTISTPQARNDWEQMKRISFSNPTGEAPKPKKKKK